MTENGRDPQAVRAYERVRDEVAEHRVVDEAEAALAGVWIRELGDMRRAALGLIAATRVAEHAALEGVRTAQRAGAPAELARAHARLAAVEAEQAVGLGQARALLEGADEELERAGHAGAERARRVERDLARLRAAWTDAYGAGSPPRED